MDIMELIFQNNILLMYCVSIRTCILLYRNECKYYYETMRAYWLFSLLSLQWNPSIILIRFINGKLTTMENLFLIYHFRSYSIIPGVLYDENIFQLNAWAVCCLHISYYYFYIKYMTFCFQSQFINH